MTTLGKVIVRFVFVICLLLVIITDYYGLLQKLIGGSKEDDEKRVAPRPTNPGYGDPMTDIDIDADIEEESVKNMGEQYLFKSTLTVEPNHPIIIFDY